MNYSQYCRRFSLLSLLLAGSLAAHAQQEDISLLFDIHHILAYIVAACMISIIIMLYLNRVYYFKTKEQLFERIFKEIIGLMGKSLIGVFTGSDKPVLERIKDAIEFHFNFICENPQLPLFIIREVASRPERFSLVKETISAVAGGLMKALQQDFDEAAKRGEIEEVEASTLMLDMLSLNAFPFLIQPLFQAAMGNKLGNVDKFYETRKKENIEIIMRRLTPRKS